MNNQDLLKKIKKGEDLDFKENLLFELFMTCGSDKVEDSLGMIYSMFCLVEREVEGSKVEVAVEEYQKWKKEHNNQNIK